MLVHRRVTLGEERHCESSVLPMNTMQCPRPGLEPGPLDPESNALTMRPLRLPIQCTVDLVYYLDCELCLVYKGQPLKEKDHCQTCCQQECINHKRTLISNIIKGTDN